MRGNRSFVWMMAIAVLLVTGSPAQVPNRDTPVAADTSPHHIQFVTVVQDVKLEVLDWGGTGRPLILLAGLGFDAHVFDAFAPKLVSAYHVYGITRRGFGASSFPKPDAANYSADRLGDDVLAVMDALKIVRPVLVGHSIAGEELSSIGSRYPDKVAGLIYLDAGYAYAFYNDKAAEGDPIVDSAEVRSELNRFASPLAPHEQKVLIGHLLQVSLPRLDADLQRGLKGLESVPDSAPAPPAIPKIQASLAVESGVQIYSGVKCPVLAIYADPHNPGPAAGNDPAKRAAMQAEDLARTSAQADAFQAGNSAAHVVRLPNADHFVFRSNEADVLGEINTFISTLP